MYLVSARKYLVHALESTSKLSFSTRVGVYFNACNYSTFCQPSLEVGDSSAGEGSDESKKQEGTCDIRETVEKKRQDLVLKAQVCLKACDYSTSCQPSLEVEDTSAGVVHEGSQLESSSCEREVCAAKKEELVLETQLLKQARSHLQQDQEEGFKRSPLKVVVRSYTKRWFKEHLRNAEKGRSCAQVIVGQMISHGYGVPKDVGKGEEWIRRASHRHEQSKDSSEKKRSQDEELYFM